MTDDVSEGDQDYEAAYLHALGALTASAVHHDTDRFVRELWIGLRSYEFEFVANLSVLALELLRELSVATNVTPDVILQRLARRRIE